MKLRDRLNNAARVISNSNGWDVHEDYNFSVIQETNPRARQFWTMALAAYEALTGDVPDDLDEEDLEETVMPWSVVVRRPGDAGPYVTTFRVGSQFFTLATGAEDDVEDGSTSKQDCQFIADMFKKAMERLGAPPPVPFVQPEGETDGP